MTAEQLSLDAAFRAREDGQERAIEHAESDYRVALWKAIEDLASSNREFTADDIRAIAGPVPAGYHYNVIGAVVEAARRSCLIRCVGYARSRSVVGHGNRIAVWRGES